MVAQKHNSDNHRSIKRIAIVTEIILITVIASCSLMLLFAYKDKPEDIISQCHNARYTNGVIEEANLSCMARDHHELKQWNWQMISISLLVAGIIVALASKSYLIRSLHK